MLFGFELTDAIQAIGVLGIAAIIFAESGLLIGFFLPGDTLLFTAGFLAHQGVLDVNIHVLVAVIFAAAVAGDSVGYAFGKRYGRRLFQKPDSVFFHQKNLRRAEEFYEKWGPLTIVIARFTPLVRTFAPIVAGIGSMHYKRFLVYNIVGGLLWATSVTYLGYYGGAFLKAQGIHVEALVVPVIAFAVLVSLVSPLWHLLGEKEGRKMVMRKLKLGKRTKGDSDRLPY